MQSYQNFQNYQSTQKTHLISNYNQSIYQDSVPYITQVTEEQNVNYLNTVPTEQTDYFYLQQIQTQYISNDYQNGGETYNTNDYYQQGYANGGEITTATATNNYEYNQNNYSNG